MKELEKLKIFLREKVDSGFEHLFSDNEVIDIKKLQKELKDFEIDNTLYSYEELQDLVIKYQSEIFKLKEEISNLKGE